MVNAPDRITPKYHAWGKIPGRGPRRLLSSLEEWTRKRKQTSSGLAEDWQDLRIYRSLCDAGDERHEPSLCSPSHPTLESEFQVSTVLDLKHIAYVFPLTSSGAITETIRIGQSTTSSGKAPTSDPRPGVLTDSTHGACPHPPLGGVWNVPSPFGRRQIRLKMPCFAAGHDIARTDRPRRRRILDGLWSARLEPSMCLGLSSETAFPVAGLVVAQSLLGSLLPTQQILTRLAH
ncbi:hypothetical protein PG997_000796 [Apiospora hydei]|uniref:Uncharacterized protein n=1 Tax=Apiospora hydei TaxID=1337664 RepID=A0ABR1XBU3_9PEZI